MIKPLAIASGCLVAALLGAHYTERDFTNAMPHEVRQTKRKRVFTQAQTNSVPLAPTNSVPLVPPKSRVVAPPGREPGWLTNKTHRIKPLDKKEKHEHD